MPKVFLLTLSKSQPFLLKQSLETLKNLKESEIISVFLDITKLADFRWKNAYVSKIQGVCHVTYIFFDFCQVRYNCVTFHHCRICVTDFREEGIFAHPHPLICEQSKKGPSWIRLMALPTNCFQQSYRATQF